MVFLNIAPSSTTWEFWSFQSLVEFPIRYGSIKKYVPTLYGKIHSTSHQFAAEIHPKGLVLRMRWRGRTEIKGKLILRKRPPRSRDTEGSGDGFSALGTKRETGFILNPKERANGFSSKWNSWEEMEYVSSLAITKSHPASRVVQRDSNLLDLPIYWPRHKSWGVHVHPQGARTLCHCPDPFHCIKALNTLSLHWTSGNSNTPVALIFHSNIPVMPASDEHLTSQHTHHEVKSLVVHGEFLAFTSQPEAFKIFWENDHGMSCVRIQSHICYEETQLQ